MEGIQGFSVQYRWQHENNLQYMDVSGWIQGFLIYGTASELATVRGHVGEDSGFLDIFVAAGGIPTVH